VILNKCDPLTLEDCARAVGHIAQALYMFAIVITLPSTLQYSPLCTTHTLVQVGGSRTQVFVERELENALE